MTIIDQVLTAKSIGAVGLLTLLWFFTVIADKIVAQLFDKKIFSPVKQSAKRKWKAFKTRYDPLKATFKFSHTPDRSFTLEQTANRVQSSVEQVERASSGKVEMGDFIWKEKYVQGTVEASFIDGQYPYEIDVELIPSTQSVREHPDEDPSTVEIGSVNFEISFKFPFHSIEGTLMNLNTFTSFLEKSIKNNISGIFSDGQFIISPLKSDLTLDDWIQEERFDVNLLLRSEDKKTRVRFAHDKAIVEPPYREIDSETVKYFKAMLVNYYL